jgi:hypothetical protein
MSTSSADLDASIVPLIDLDLVENIGRFFARFADVPDPTTVALEIWSRFQNGDPPS